MIRITMVKDSYTSWNGAVIPARTEVKEFEDTGAAISWFTEDSYFEESYTRKAVWERIP